jgi:hypothetical protein
MGEDFCSCSNCGEATSDYRGVSCTGEYCDDTFCCQECADKCPECERERKEKEMIKEVSKKTIADNFKEFKKRLTKCSYKLHDVLTESKKLEDEIDEIIDCIDIILEISKVAKNKE